MKTTIPSISVQQAEELLKLHYGLDATATYLYGDQDLNYQIHSPEGNFLLKLSTDQRANRTRQEQEKILVGLVGKISDLSIPGLKPALNGALEISTQVGQKTISVRLFSWITGRLWANVNPHTQNLRAQLGSAAGKLNRAMRELPQQEGRSNFRWDLAQSNWTTDHTNDFQGERLEWIRYFQGRFEDLQPAYGNLRKQLIHNDLNDYNIVVSEEAIEPQVKGFIDFGDACYSQSINELAILITYAVMGTSEPLGAACEVILAYQDQSPLQEDELIHLYALVGMRLVTSVTVSHIRKQEDPEDEYLVISEEPAWNLLEQWFQLSEELAHYSFRNACGKHAHPSQDAFYQWANGLEIDIRELFPDQQDKKEVVLLDLKPSSTWAGSREEFNDLDLFQFRIDRLQAEFADKFIAGGYLEPRPLYTSTAYDRDGNSGSESRTVHLGVDFWLPAGTPVHALFHGTVFTATNDAGFKEYGGLIILKHKENGIEFFTLYGHLSADSPNQFAVGDTVEKGQQLGVLGEPSENGVWAPHLHFQIMLSMLDYTLDFPGVGYKSELAVWKSLCPDPNLLFSKEELTTQYDAETEDLIHRRSRSLGKSLSLSYREPLHIVRGDGPYLMDPWARKYLDTVNNVAHVGHEHPAVVQAAKKQLSVLNTNTRYLHPAVLDYADRLRKKLPDHIEVIYLVNSGSEANELALRMANTWSGSKEILALEMGYHGNTNAVIDVSSYKFDRKGGGGKPAHTHLLPLPDPFRGIHTDKDCGEKYSRYALERLKSIERNGTGPASFIHESILSCGGQIVPPENYFNQIYSMIQEAGGLCIADEVQTGFGRTGSRFWAFELFGLEPDIVTMGKPAGNGHPLGIVACTRKVAERFANGMEFFNTFGGNPVSSRTGKAVLDVILKDELQSHAQKMGDYLKAGLRKLQQEHPILADIRGEGLFLGVELCDLEKRPLTPQTNYLVNRMKEFGILTSSDGPDENVIKIKPPMVFDKVNADEFLGRLSQIISEDFMKKI
ncbi:aminotransferase class III-fold pyridoxal phosphate-dependent enzyme [Aureitalea marina]|uniref:Peptidase M23 n=1 Tax=Aureitalea marina TaxID=930804 RepID=A0A2S7KLJ8_9FLAO|nr:aminotransferase class III-fold pyridoxal phosphate-dependent enzyme [Aureitalea marina]PQB03482.1 peptidase M23 [Aureitalea marina]